MATNSSVTPYHILRSALSLYQKTPVNLDGSERQRVELQALREASIEQAILSSEDARGVVVPEATVKDALLGMQQQYPSQEDFESDLADNHLSRRLLWQSLERQLRVEAVMERVGSRVAEVSEVEAQIHYYMHKDRYQLPETRTVRQILITINDDFADNTRDQAKKRITTIRERLSRKPKRFEEQAIKHSECPTAMQGGLLGRVEQGQLYPELDAVAFSLNAGELSDVVESELGFHLLRCDEIHDAGEVPPETILSSIADKLTERRRRQCQQAWLGRLLKADREAELSKSHEPLAVD